MDGEGTNGSGPVGAAGPVADRVRSPRILIVDDESEVTDACARILGRRYLTVKTSSPFEAVSFMDAGRNMIDLVICDYSMPGMNGSEFVDAIRNHGVDTPVILCSGRVLERREEEIKKFAKVLEKPFGEAELLQLVSSVLFERTGGGNTYRRFRGALPHLDIFLESLERFLKGSGLEQPGDVSPPMALERLGQGEAYDVFLSWRSMQELRAKILA